MIRPGIANGIAAALILCGSFSHSLAADKKPKPASGDLESLRQSIDAQSKQIEALTEQIIHLSQVLEARGIPVNGTPSPAPQHPSTAPENPSAAVSGPTQPAPENSGTHIVAKGETLTSIAKHYKITVGDLEKVNKIENDRTLQIGQTLTIPMPTPSATPQEKKENQ